MLGLELGEGSVLSNPHGHLLGEGGLDGERYRGAH